MKKFEKQLNQFVAMQEQHRQQAADRFAEVFGADDDLPVAPGQRAVGVDKDDMPVTPDNELTGIKDRMAHLLNTILTDEHTKH